LARNEKGATFELPMPFDEEKTPGGVNKKYITLN
jgi:hypothetical protein